MEAAKGFIPRRSQTISFQPGKHGIQKKELRNVWKQKDAGTVNDSISKEIPPHGVFLVKLY